MIALRELLKITNSPEINAFFVGFNFKEVRGHLESLVLESSLPELKYIIKTFNNNDNFDFLEDFICDGNVEVMGEDDYWELV